MAISLDFVSICLSEENCSPAGTVTVKRLEKLDRPGQIRRIRSTAQRNLRNTLRIMHFLRGHQICVYRMSAQLIPLATHPVTDGWKWWDDPELYPYMVQIGEAVKAQQIRISSHLPEFCVLTSDDPDKLRWVKLYLDYHQRLFDTMQLDARAKIILHLGGASKDRMGALARAVRNIKNLSSWARARLCLENDDRVFSAVEILDVCRQTGASMVFDFHHHYCRNDGEDFRELLPDIFATWSDRPPKIHISSPRDEKNVRAHADFVDLEFVRPVIEAAQALGDVDFMVEAKKKDLALFRLREELGAL